MLPNFSYKQRREGQTWILPSKDQITVIYGIHFDDLTDSFMAKLILNEMEEANRKVVNSPAIKRMDNIP